MDQSDDVIDEGIHSSEKHGDQDTSAPPADAAIVTENVSVEFLSLEILTQNSWNMVTLPSRSLICHWSLRGHIGRSNLQEIDFRKWPDHGPICRPPDRAH